MTTLIALLMLLARPARAPRWSLPRGNRLVPSTWPTTMCVPPCWPRSERWSAIRTHDTCPADRCGSRGFGRAAHMAEPHIALSPRLDGHIPGRVWRRLGSWRPARCCPARRRPRGGGARGGAKFAVERHGHVIDLARGQHRCTHQQCRQVTWGEQVHITGVPRGEQQLPFDAQQAQCWPDRHGGQSGGGEDVGNDGGLASSLLEQLRPVPALDPQFSTSTASLEFARVVLRVDGPDPGRRDQDVVDVRARAGDAPTVQSTRRRQTQTTLSIARPTARSPRPPYAMPSPVGSRAAGWRSAGGRRQRLSTRRRRERASRRPCRRPTRRQVR